MTHHASVRKQWRPELATETVILLATIVLAAFANIQFWRGTLAGRELADPWAWCFGAATLVFLVCLHFIVLGLVIPRRAVRPVLAVLIVTSVVANHFMQRYGVVLDPSMLRNALHTDAREAAELVTGDTLIAFALGASLAALLWTVRLRRRTRGRSLFMRLGCVGIALVAGAGALLVAYQDLGSLMRNHKTLRYTITPASLGWSLSQVLISDARATTRTRDPSEPAHRRLAVSAGRKPTLLVMVVGETARAANFSLNGYPRATNPELMRMDVINFPHTRACGTSTEVSLPCMFSPFGRADYDETRIRNHESLLHVLAHAGFRVVWLDNQSGCKGVCDGLEARDLGGRKIDGFCPDGRCYDEILSHELGRIAREESRDLVVVLHQLGNHGPAYFRRYPADSQRFGPACEKNELRDCTREEIVNAYDNAIAYTDHFLAGTIRLLDGLRARFDVAMLYVSDHGESLGEMGLFLHGVPYAIAPTEQLDVPMLWWLPADAARRLGVDVQCVRSKASNQASHDNLYHSVLGLLAVDTPQYRLERDLFTGCRSADAG